MPNVLLKNARTAFSGQKSQLNDIFISNGNIQETIPNDLPLDSEIKDLDGSIVFNNMIDLGTTISEPGHEYRETLEQTCEAASLGGFSAIISFPNTFPSIDNRSSIEYLRSRSGKFHGIQILPIGALTKANTGEELAEILEMNEAGAIAFSDGNHPVKNGGMLLRGFDYIKGIQKVLLSTPYDMELFPKGQIHEGYISTLLGVPGIPAPAEEIIVHRDIELARYTQGKLHINCISTKGSVELIRKAKAEGLDVTCSVSVNNLIFSVEDLLEYDSNLKLLPPLREKETCIILWEAVKDGTIDVITSQHRALEPEKKDLEFPYASFGAMGLQTAIIALLTKYPEEETIPILQKVFSENIIRIFGLVEYFKEDKITIFDKCENYTFGINELASNSYNSPFIGRSFNYKLNHIKN